jgi:hypothetical protein
MNTFVYINGRPDHMKGQHDDLLMSLAMAIYVSEISFTQLKKVDDLTKVMIESWAINSHDNSAVTSFNPNVPVFVDENQKNVFRNQPTRQDYQDYRWVFGGMGFK